MSASYNCAVELKNLSPANLAVCTTVLGIFQLGLVVHRDGEFGIQPNLVLQFAPPMEIQLFAGTSIPAY